MAKRVIYTREQFREALVLVLGQEYFDFIKSDTTRADRAIIKIFLEHLEGRRMYTKAAVIIRSVTLIMQEEGVYKFAE